MEKLSALQDEDDHEVSLYSVLTVSVDITCLHHHSITETP